MIPITGMYQSSLRRDHDTSLARGPRYSIALFFAISFCAAHLAPTSSEAQPLTITQPGTYRGVWSNPDGPCVTITATSGPVAIEGSVIGPCGGAGIYQAYHGSDIVVQVQGNAFHDIPHTAAVHLTNAVNSVVSGNSFIRTNNGLYAQTAKGVQFVSNLAIDVQQRQVGEHYVGGSLACYAAVRNASLQNLIACNKVDNRAGSTPGDVINVYNSHGSAAMPIVVRHNKLRSVTTTSQSTTGIILGDGGGTYQVAEENIVVQAAATGLGIAGGAASHMALLNNKAYSDGHPRVYFGIGVGDYYDQGCSNVEVRGNQINWCATGCAQDRTGSNAGPYGACSGVIEPFRRSSQLSRGIWDEPIARCPGRDAGNTVVSPAMRVAKTSTTYGPAYYAYQGEAFTVSVRAEQQAAYIALVDADTGAVLCGAQRACTKVFNRADVGANSVRRVRTSVYVNTADSIVLTMTRTYAPGERGQINHE